MILREGVVDVKGGRSQTMIMNKDGPGSGAVDTAGPAVHHNHKVSSLFNHCLCTSKQLGQMV